MKTRADIEQEAQPQGKEKFLFVNRLFDQLAPSYDRSNQLISLGRHQAWRRTTVKLAGDLDEGMVLDLGTGTGDLAFLFAKQASTVIGLDSSDEMIRIAREKSVANKLQDQVTFTRGDALALPFPDSTFQCTVTGFAARNFQDMGQAFAEMRRVTKPGGRVISLEFTPPAGLFRILFFPYLRFVLPLLGLLAGGNRQAYNWLNDSIKEFPDAQTVKTTMENIGLEKVKFKLLNLGTVAVHVGWK